MIGLAIPAVFSALPITGKVRILINTGYTPVIAGKSRLKAF
jgi:hypothetical protein